MKAGDTLWFCWTSGRTPDPVKIIKIGTKYVHIAGGSIELRLYRDTLKNAFGGGRAYLTLEEAL